MSQSPRAKPRGVRDTITIDTECPWSNYFRSHLPLAEHARKDACYLATLYLTKPSSKKDACNLATLVHAKTRCSPEQSIIPMGIMAHNSLLNTLKWDLRSILARCYVVTKVYSGL